MPFTRLVVLSVNSLDHAIEVDTRMTLLDALREKCGLAGSKKGCDQGQCGACTIHINGERHLACLTLTVAAQGLPITTVEGLAQGERLHPMQQAFLDHDGFQCGYCTSGQIMSAIACVREGNANCEEDIREYMSGTLCRCAAYPNIVAAVKQAKIEMERGRCDPSPIKQQPTPPRPSRSPPIGLVGTAAAIANAVYHATGKRVRDLPILMECLYQESDP